MLAIVAVYVLAVLLLCAGFHFAHLLDSVRQISAVARTAYSTMTDSSLDDLQKEQTIQRCAIEMVKQAVRLIVKLVVILLVTVSPVWLASFLGWMDVDSFKLFAVRLDVLLVTTVVILVPVIVLRQIRKPGR